MPVPTTYASSAPTPRDYPTHTESMIRSCAIKADLSNLTARAGVLTGTHGRAAQRPLQRGQRGCRPAQATAQRPGMTLSTAQQQTAAAAGAQPSMLDGMLRPVPAPARAAAAGPRASRLNDPAMTSSGAAWYADRAGVWNFASSPRGSGSVSVPCITHRALSASSHGAGKRNVVWLQHRANIEGSHQNVGQCVLQINSKLGAQRA